jgi:hypothetical protein
MSSPKLPVAFTLCLALITSHVGRVQAFDGVCGIFGRESLTLAKEFRSNTVVAVAKLVHRPEIPPGANACECTFELFNVIKASKHLQPHRKPDGQVIVKTDYWGDAPLESNLLLTAYWTDMPFAPDDGLLWASPTPVSDQAVDYISRIPLLPESGAQRLAFLLPYLDEPDAFVHEDVRREFEAVPFAELKKLKPLLKREDQLAKIGNFRIDSPRQKLALRLLAVCGTHDDVAFLESLMRNTDQKIAASRTAQIECYLALRGEAGLSLVEQQFLSDPKADYTDTYGALLALKYTWDETRAVPRPRLLAGMRLLLDRPDIADIVIPHLSARQDWSVVDRLVTLFEQADPKENWVRLPVVNYLRTCPLPEAKVHLERLAEIDPEVVRRSENYYPIKTAAAP